LWLQVMELLGNMHPTNSSYRIDLLTKSYTQLKEQLLQTTHTINTSSSTSGANGAMALGALAGSGPVTQLTEPWFGFDAISVPLPDQLTASWASSGEGDELGLPPPNPYIPTDFNLKFTAEAAARPAGDSQQKQQQQQQQQQQPKQLHKKEKEQQQQPAMKVLPGVQDWMLVGDSAAAADIDSILATPPAMLVDDPGEGCGQGLRCLRMYLYMHTWQLGMSVPDLCTLQGGWTNGRMGVMPIRA
jgi:hypothetical protein